MKVFIPLYVVLFFVSVSAAGFLNRAVNRLFNDVKFAILALKSIGTDSLFEPASSGDSINCSFGALEVATRLDFI